VHGEDIGAAVCIGEGDRDRHLAAQRGICRLELDHFDNLLVRHELTKRPWNVSVCAVARRLSWRDGWLFAADATAIPLGLKML
jgi:hypothetical protein